MPKAYPNIPFPWFATEDVSAIAEHLIELQELYQQTAKKLESYVYSHPFRNEMRRCGLANDDYLQAIYRCVLKCIVNGRDNKYVLALDIEESLNEYIADSVAGYKVVLPLAGHLMDEIPELSAVSKKIGELSLRMEASEQIMDGRQISDLKSEIPGHAVVKRQMLALHLRSFEDALYSEKRRVEWQLRNITKAVIEKEGLPYDAEELFVDHALAHNRVMTSSLSFIPDFFSEKGAPSATYGLWYFLFNPDTIAGLACVLGLWSARRNPSMAVSVACGRRSWP